MADSAEKCLLDSPVGVLARSLHFHVIVHVGDSVVQEGNQVVGFALLVSGLVLADLLQQVNHRVLGHVQGLSEVVLLANILNGVLRKQLLISLRNQHDGDRSLVHDILDEGLQLLEGLWDLNGIAHKLDVEVEALAADKVSLASEHQLQVDVEQLLGESLLEPFLELFELVLHVGWVSVLAKQTVGNL